MQDALTGTDPAQLQARAAFVCRKLSTLISIKFDPYSGMRRRSPNLFHLIWLRVIFTILEPSIDIHTPRYKAKHTCTTYWDN